MERKLSEDLSFDTLMRQAASTAEYYAQRAEDYFGSDGKKTDPILVSTFMIVSAIDYFTTHMSAALNALDDSVGKLAESLEERNGG